MQNLFCSSSSGMAPLGELGSLLKLTAVEVFAAKLDAPSQNVEGTNLTTWIGFLRSELLGRLVPFSLEAECGFLEEDGEIYIPLAASLVAVAQEHFAFFSAQETAGVGQPHVDGEALEGVREEFGLVDLIHRMSNVESVFEFQQDNMT